MLTLCTKLLTESEGVPDNHEEAAGRSRSPETKRATLRSVVAVTYALRWSELITIQFCDNGANRRNPLHKRAQICHPYCQSERLRVVLHSGIDEPDVVPDLSSIEEKLRSVSHSNPAVGVLWVPAIWRVDRRTRAQTMQQTFAPNPLCDVCPHKQSLELRGKLFTLSARNITVAIKR